MLLSQNRLVWAILQLKSGKIMGGWLGVIIQDMTPKLAKSFDLKEARGP